jgi:hypothetical protein
MKLLKFKTFFIYALVGLHFLLAIYYSFRMPWDGDEWYTYNGTTIMALPYQLLINVFNLFLTNLTVSNYIIFRQIGAIFIFILFLFLIIKRKEEAFREFTIISILYTALSAFVIFQEQYFRYYSLYLLLAFVIFYYQLKYFADYNLKRIYFYAFLILSPFLHFFLTWQLVFYLAYQEFNVLSKSIKTVIGLFFSLIFVGFIFFWKPIMTFVLPLAFEGMEAQGTGLRGFSKNIVLKPIVYFIQFFFGHHVAPNENQFVIFLTIGIFISLILSLLILYKIQKSKFWFITICGILPFLLMFVLLEPLTLPGSTQFESKHATFIIPFILYTFTFLKNTKPIFQFAFKSLLITSLVYGVCFSMGNIYQNWDRIKLVSNLSDYIITDGRANLTTAFYLNKDTVKTYYNNEFQDKICTDSKSIFLVYNDYRSYQLLTKEQMWNTGSSSEFRNMKASILLKQLHKNGFKAVDSYSHYPFMCYRFEKTSQIQPIPWFYGQAYSDLHLPINMDENTILGWFPYQFGDTIFLTKPFYYMIESSSTETYNFELIKSDNTKSQLKFINETDKFRSNFCMAFLGYDKKVKEWHKRPLLSSSLAYPGSYFPGTGYIYQFNPIPNDKKLVVKGKGVKVWVGVEK